MAFGLIKSGTTARGDKYYEYGFSKADMDTVRQQWEVSVRNHQIKYSHLSFPPTPPKIDSFVPRMTFNQREDAINKHAKEDVIEVRNKTNGNIQIVVQKSRIEKELEESLEEV